MGLLTKVFLGHAVVKHAVKSANKPNTFQKYQQSMSGLEGAIGLLVDKKEKKLELERQRQHQEELELKRLEQAKRWEEARLRRKEEDREYAKRNGMDSWFENEYRETIDGKKL